jgi:CheY-like chemotaxis protein
VCIECVLTANSPLTPPSPLSPPPHQVDLVYMDFHLAAGFNAIDYLRLLKRRGVSVVAMSADDTVQQIENCLREGLVLDYIVKPVTLKDIQVRTLVHCTLVHSYTRTLVHSHTLTPGPCDWLLQRPMCRDREIWRRWSHSGTRYW